MCFPIFVLFEPFKDLGVVLLERIPQAIDITTLVINQAAAMFDQQTQLPHRHALRLEWFEPFGMTYE